MSLFVLDAGGDQQLLNHKSSSYVLTKKIAECLLDEDNNLAAAKNSDCEDDSNEENEDDGDYFGLPPPSVDISKIINSTLNENATAVRKNTDEQYMEHVSQLVDSAVQKARKRRPPKRKPVTQLDYSEFNPLTGKPDDEQLIKTNVERELAKVEVGLEKKKELPSLPKKAIRKLNRNERAKTKGASWYNLPATELTEEVKNDLKILQMRSVLDPKHFYKKNDLKVLPKYFQIGTVQHSPLDFYKERDTRKNKKTSLVDELLTDADFQKYTKRKYNEIVARKDKYAHRKAMKKMKQLKKKK